jgi:hypothetical protein
MPAKGKYPKSTYWYKRANRIVHGRKPRKKWGPPLGQLPNLAKPLAIVSSEFTKERGGLVIQAFNEGLPSDMVAAMVGVTPGVMKQWLREAADLLDLAVDRDISGFSDRERELCEFLLKFQKAIAGFHLKNLAYIKKQRGRWWQAAAWILERRFPEYWGKHDKVTHEETRPTSQIDVKVLIAHPEGARAVSDIFKALAEQQDPLGPGSSSPEPGGLGEIRQQSDMAIRESLTLAERIPIGSGGGEDNEVDDLDPTEARQERTD